MRKTPGSHWLRRNTTVDDLLDEGAENGSDMRVFSEDPPPGPGPHADGLQAQRAAYTLDQQQRAVSAAHISVRRSRSVWGTATGIACMVAGAWLILHPVAMWVAHPGMKRAWPLMERVSEDGATFYGAVLVVFGAVLTGFSLYAPLRRA